MKAKNTKHLLFSFGDIMQITLADKEVIDGVVTISSQYESFVFVTDEPIEEENLSIFFEDNELSNDCIKISEDKMSFSIVEKRYFGEIYGIIDLVINLNNSVFEFKLDVLNTKFQDVEIENMLYFLLNSDHYKHPVLGQMKQNICGFGVAQILSNLDAVGKFVKLFEEYHEFFENSFTKKTKKINTKFIERPQKIMQNAYYLSLSNKKTDIIIQNFFFNYNKKSKNKSVKEDYNTPENKFILAFLYLLKDYLNGFISGNFKPYEIEKSKKIKNFSSTVFRLTYKKIEVLANNLSDRIVYFIEVLENDFSIKPKSTRIVNISFLKKSFYGKVFDLIDEINIAQKDDNMLGFNKLDSCAKLYEFYCLFSMVNKITSNGFDVVSQKSNKHFVFENLVYTISLIYDSPLKKKNQANVGDLIDITHNTGRSYQPDFVLHVVDKSVNKSGYYIFDAKYSKENIILSERLPDIINKYYFQTSVSIGGDSFSNDSVFNVSAFGPSNIDDVYTYNKRELSKFFPSFCYIKTDILTKGSSCIFFEKILDKTTWK